MARPPRRASTTGDRTDGKETEETLCASPPVVVFRLLLLASGTPAYMAAKVAGRWLQTLLRLENTALPDQAAAERRQTDPERENYRTADCDRSKTGLNMTFNTDPQWLKKMAAAED